MQNLRLTPFAPAFLTLVSLKLRRWLSASGIAVLNRLTTLSVACKNVILWPSVGGHGDGPPTDVCRIHGAIISRLQNDFMSNYKCCQLFNHLTQH